MDEIASIQAAITLGRQQLVSVSETASLDIQVLLAHLLGRSKAWLLAHPEYHLPEVIQKNFLHALGRLLEGEPLPYILERWEFYGRNFKVTPQVLIPRPETEGLIELALGFIDRTSDPCTILDVGTGSGCIAITLAAERATCRVIAIDRSREALKIAQENVNYHRVTERVSLLQGDLLEGIHQRVDLVVANLPYIPTARLRRLPVAAHEPHLALNGGELGMDLVVRLIALLPGCLLGHGMALLEIDETHSQVLVEQIRKTFPKAQVNVLPDLNLKDRFITLQLGMTA